jgi:hypothetical protein
MAGSRPEPPGSSPSPPKKELGCAGVAAALAYVPGSLRSPPDALRFGLGVPGRLRFEL